MVVLAPEMRQRVGGGGVASLTRGRSLWGRLVSLAGIVEAGQLWITNWSRLKFAHGRLVATE